MVLDIGTGTGLLSMLAVRAGAAEVYGCELYAPLAEIARDVTSLNCGDKIKARLYLCFATLRIMLSMEESGVDTETILYVNLSRVVSFLRLLATGGPHGGIDAWA